ncbi:MAG: ATP-binding protein [Bacteroidales bacterium]|nr:ATP-binding protein [Bacteroidales bacterium]
MSFRQRLFLSFSAIFTVFTLLVLVFQYEREKNFKKLQLESTLDNITEIAHKYLENKAITRSGQYMLMDSILEILPARNIRLTMTDRGGTVLYDSEVPDYSSMENHLSRTEFQEALESGSGGNIRKSTTTGKSYYYYAKRYPEYYIRTATLYDVGIRDLLNVESLFIFYLALLFLATSIVLFYMTRRFSETINKLKDFTIRLRGGEEINESFQFPKDELGIISTQITSLYKDFNDARKKLVIEKNKLYSHLSVLNEGIAFFSPQKEKVLANNHFIQNLNLLSEKSALTAEKIFKIRELRPVIKFIDRHLEESSMLQEDELPHMDMDLQKGNRYFNVKCFFFQDKSFEIVILDTTKLEKRKLIKQQMTSNIAHELKTPVATVMGYLESIQHESITPEKKDYFVEKAHAQAQRLSELIDDLSTLNRIEEAGEYYELNPVSITQVVEEVREQLRMKLDQHHIQVHLDLPGKLEIEGNRSLLFSIFYNLFDNAIKYGGDHIQIFLSSYLEDKKNYYFSFANTGKGIDDIHLNRIFERFYRIDDGRSRKTGGTGLGLAIVKNAIQLHNGEISARNYRDGGLEFLFSLEK